MLRKFKRSIARHNMKLAGLERLNSKDSKKEGRLEQSLFARRWREYLVSK